MHLIRWIVLGLSGMALAGCSLFGRTWVEAPEAGMEKVVTQEHADGSKTTTAWKHTAKGSAMSTTDPKQAKTSPVSVTEAGASVGKSTFAFDLNGSGMTVLYVVCGIIFAAGVVLGICFGWKLGLIVCGSAIALLGCVAMFQAYPWLMVVPLAGLVAAGGYVLYRAWRGQSVQQTLQTVVSAVEIAPVAASAAVKDRVSALSGPNTDAVTADVREAKSAPEVRASIAAATASPAG